MDRKTQKKAGTRSRLPMICAAAGWALVLIWLLLHRQLFYAELSGKDYTGLAGDRHLLFPGLLAGVLLALPAGAARRIVREKAGEQLRLLRPFFALTGILLNSLFSFWIIEFLCRNLDIYTFLPKYKVLNTGITLAVYLILVFLLNSVRAGMVTGNILFLLFGLTNYFVYRFRNIPFQIIDITGLQTAANVAGSYRFELTWQILTAVTLVLLVSGIWTDSGKTRIFRSIPGKLLSRVLAAGLAAAFYLVIFRSALFDNLNIRPYSWRPNDSYNMYGCEAAFCAFAKISYPKRPETYSAARVAEIIDGVRKQAEESDLPVPENIICVMNESFADLSVYPNVNPAQDPMPFYRSLRENAQKGTLMVSVQGGTTANTEYEFLTGNSMMLAPNSIPFTTYIQTDQFALPRILAEMGYRSVAVHPYYASGWRRDEVYPRLGFAEFHDKEAFDVRDPEKIRRYISDREDVEYLIDLLEQKPEGEKLFLFNVTMQNHGGYEYDGDDFQSSVHLVDFPGNAKDAAEQYLTCIRLSDAALEELVSYLSGIDEKTLLLFFGDHQPGLPVSFYPDALGVPEDQQTFEMQQLQYETVWTIWANYDIPEADGLVMSPNYLSSYLLSLTGLPLTGYQQYLLNQKETIPAMNAFGYLGNDGQQHPYGEETQEEASYLEDYRCLMYSELTAGRKRDGSFFGTGVS